MRRTPTPGPRRPEAGTPGPARPFVEEMRPTGGSGSGRGGSIRAVRRAARAGGILALALALPPDVHGQTVEARTLEGDGRAVEGVLVRLVDGAEVERDGGFSDRSGVVRLGARGAGTYRLVAERIGYDRAVTEPFRLSAGESREVRIVLSSRPVSVPDLTVAVEDRCRSRPDSAVRTHRVWEAARKALEAADWAAGRSLYRVVRRRWSRRLDRRGSFRRTLETAQDSGYAMAPFRSLPAERLSREGYVRVEGSGHVSYGPDAGVLLSDAFLTDHCFRAERRDEGGGSWIVLHFRPVDGRRVPEIQGTLWLDPGTGELDRLEFEYVGVRWPAGLGRGDAGPGGVVWFHRVPGGPWIVREWRIRLPVFTRGIVRVGGLRASGPRLAGYQEEGGRTLRVATADGEVLWSAEAPDRPRAWDRLRRVAEAAQAAREAAPSWWSGFFRPRPPILLYAPGDGALLLGGAEPPAGFRSVPAGDLPAALKAGVHVRVGTPEGLSGELDTGFPVGAGRAVAAPVRPDRADPGSLTETIFHEAFHAWQWDRFRDPEAGSAYLSDGALDDPRLLTLLHRERRALAVALRAEEGPGLVAASRRYLRLRRARGGVGPEEVAEAYAGLERIEGTAHLVGLLARAAAEGASRRSLDSLLAAELEAPPDTVSSRSLYEAVVRRPAYASGAALARLLDRWAVPWRRRVAGGRGLAELLAERVPPTGGPAAAPEIGPGPDPAALLEWARRARREVEGAAPDPPVLVLEVTEDRGPGRGPGFPRIHFDQGRGGLVRLAEDRFLLPSPRIFRATSGPGGRMDLWVEEHPVEVRTGAAGGRPTLRLVVGLPELPEEEVGRFLGHGDRRGFGELSFVTDRTELRVDAGGHLSRAADSVVVRIGPAGPP